jgi:hypothetical protein
MKSHILAAAIAASALFLSGSAQAYESLMKMPCSVADRHSPPVHMQDCLIRSSMAQGVVLWVVTTPDGRRFRIENDERNLNRWRVNGAAAKETFNGTCYESRQVSVCAQGDSGF